MLKILSVIWVSAALVGTYAFTHSIEKAAFIASAVLIGCVLAIRRFRPEMTSDTAPPPIFPTFVPRTLAERREQAMKEAAAPIDDEGEMLPPTPNMGEFGKPYRGPTYFDAKQYRKD